MDCIRYKIYCNVRVPENPELSISVQHFRFKEIKLKKNLNVLQLKHREYKRPRGRDIERNSVDAWA